jgi:hypothetical protein
MAFNVKLGASSTGNFKVKFDSASQDYTLKNDITAGGRLDSLGDVNPATSANGSILVYDSGTDTYVQRDILSYDTESGAFKLDGGGEF